MKKWHGVWLNSSQSCRLHQTRGNNAGKEVIGFNLQRRVSLNLICGMRFLWKGERVSVFAIYSANISICKLYIERDI